MSQRHQELKLRLYLSVKECFACIGMYSITSADVERFIKHLESKGYEIIKKKKSNYTQQIGDETLSQGS